MFLVATVKLTLKFSLGDKNHYYQSANEKDREAFFFFGETTHYVSVKYQFRHFCNQNKPKEVYFTANGTELRELYFTILVIQVCSLDVWVVLFCFGFCFVLFLKRKDCFSEIKQKT